MSTNPEIERYTSDAARAGKEAKAWETLLVHASRVPELAEALAAIDLTGIEGPLDTAAIEVGLAVARIERDRYQAMAQVETRRAVAGLEPDAHCRCGHDSSLHARRLVDECRLPCGIYGCDCQDLALVPKD